MSGIVPGNTTKQELFMRFGPPIAIAVRDEVIAVPALMVQSMGSITIPEIVYPEMVPHEYRFQSNTFFELFSGGREFTEYHRLYYYEHVVVTRCTPYFFLIAVYERGYAKIDRLWVLVNEKTGILEDYRVKRYRQPMTFGSPNVGGNGRDAELLPGAVQQRREPR